MTRSEKVFEQSNNFVIRVVNQYLFVVRTTTDLFSKLHDNRTVRIIYGFQSIMLFQSVCFYI